MKTPLPSQRSYHATSARLPRFVPSWDAAEKFLIGELFAGGLFAAMLIRWMA